MFVNTMSINLSVSIYVYWGPRPSVVSIIRYYYYESRHLQHTSARQPLSFCTWSSEPHRRFAPRVHEAAATRTSYVTVHTCTMRVEKVCKVREEPAPCLITAQGATGCDGVWQCVAGRLSDKVLAPRSTVSLYGGLGRPWSPPSSEWVLGSHRSGPPCGSGVGSLACLFKMGATRLRFREFALLPKRVTLKWLPRKGGSDSSPSYWPHLRNTQRNAFNRTLYMVLSSPLPAERESRRRVPPLPRRVPH